MYTEQTLKPVSPQTLVPAMSTGATASPWYLSFYNLLALTRSRIYEQAKDNDLWDRGQRLPLPEPGPGLGPWPRRHALWGTSQSEPSVLAGSWTWEIHRVKLEASVAPGEQRELGQAHGQVTGVQRCPSLGGSQWPQMVRDTWQFSLGHMGQLPGWFLECPPHPDMLIPTGQCDHVLCFPKPEGASEPQSVNLAGEIPTPPQTLGRSQSSCIASTGPEGNTQGPKTI